MNLSELIAAGASEAEINKHLKDALDGFARELEWVFAKRSADANRPVSYTHLTLPTIYSV